MLQFLPPLSDTYQHSATFTCTISCSNLSCNLTCFESLQPTFYQNFPYFSKDRKIECTLVQALRLSTSLKAHKESRVIALPFHDHDTRRGWGVSVTPRLLFIPGKDSVPVVREAGWTPCPVWTGLENLAPTGIRSPDRPLYRLHCPAHIRISVMITKV
jgi:hypothetical protein